MSIVEQLSPREIPGPPRLTVQQYHRMIEEGVIPEGAPLELIDGMIVRKNRADREGDPMSVGTRHSSAITGLQESLEGVKAAGCLLRIQQPLTAADDQEPEPDINVVRGTRRDYFERHPEPKDVVALVEVADSSLSSDRGTKKRVYASTGIAVYWIVNLVDMQIEVYQNPQPAAGEYADCTLYRSGQIVKLVVAPGVEIEVAVGDVLPADTAIL